MCVCVCVCVCARVCACKYAGVHMLVHLFKLFLFPADSLHFCTHHTLLCRYGDAVDHASVVLGVQPDNVKALYRRGQAHFERGRDIDSALADLEKAHSLQPENDAVRKLLLQCRREVAAKTKQDRVKYAGMFD
jgi:tetratricopeptide (TPR) repeat protein